MFDAISPSEASINDGAPKGVLEVAFACAGEITRLSHLHQGSPLRALFPLPAEGEWPTAALITTSGGLVGGDDLQLTLTTQAGASASFIAGAAEKIYRSAGRDVCIDVHLRAKAGSQLEFLPQETILFEGSRLRRRTRLDLATGASVLAGEFLVFGRTARGEVLTHGLIRDAWEIRREGRLVWADALHLDGDLAGLLAAPAGFQGARAIATLIFVGEQAPALLPPLRDLIAERAEIAGLRLGATLVNGLLLVRGLAEDSLTLRRAFAALWGQIRASAYALPNAPPRLWHI